MKWKYLYCPWRQKYTQSLREEQKSSEKKSCVFCNQFAQQEDEKNFFLHRYAHHVVMLNLYPYNAGHLLIVPYQHTSCLEFDDEILLEHIQLVRASVTILTTVLKAHGCNVGINIGEVSGAGIPEHLHVHVLPRWKHDTNFLGTLSDTKHISVDLVQLYHQLRPHFQALTLSPRQ